MAAIKLQNVKKSYGAVEVLHGVSLDIDDGEFLILVGPSGCGKSTLLRMIAGLEPITSGEVILGDSVINALPPRHRDIAMVFQSYALYPHMTVRKNMAFSLKLAGASKSDINEKVINAARVLDLEELLDRKPSALSGGQRQRVAMGRAIVRNPKLFLFDEPLSNLDAKLRVQMRAEIKELHQRLASTIIYVTHDQVEAMTMANRIVVMNNGHVEQVGTPMELYDTPQTLFVAEFIGSPAMNTLRGHIDEAGLFHSTNGGSFHLGSHGPEVSSNTDIVLGVRPEAIDLQGDGLAIGDANIRVIEPTGSETLLTTSLAGDSLLINDRTRQALSAGDLIPVTVNPSNLHFFDGKQGQRIR